MGIALFIAIAILALKVGLRWDAEDRKERAEYFAATGRSY